MAVQINNFIKTRNYHLSLSENSNLKIAVSDAMKVEQEVQSEIETKEKIAEEFKKRAKALYTVLEQNPKGYYYNVLINFQTNVEYTGGGSPLFGSGSSIYFAKGDRDYTTKQTINCSIDTVIINTNNNTLTLELTVNNQPQPIIYYAGAEAMRKRYPFANFPSSLTLTADLSDASPIYNKYTKYTTDQNTLVFNGARIYTDNDPTNPLLGNLKTKSPLDIEVTVDSTVVIKDEHYYAKITSSSKQPIIWEINTLIDVGDPIGDNSTIYYPIGDPITDTPIEGPGDGDIPIPPYPSQG